MFSEKDLIMFHACCFVSPQELPLLLGDISRGAPLFCCWNDLPRIFPTFFCKPLDDDQFSGSVFRKLFKNTTEANYLKD